MARNVSIITLSDDIGRRRGPAAGGVEIEAMIAAQQRDALGFEPRTRFGPLNHHLSNAGIGFRQRSRWQAKYVCLRRSQIALEHAAARRE